MSTLFQELQKTALDRGDSPAIYYLGKELSYSFLLKKIDDLAFWCNENFKDKNEIITVCLPNIPQSVFIFYALNKLGIAMDFVHPDTPPKQLRKFMDKVKSKTVFLLDFKYPDYAETLDGMNIIVCSIQTYLPKLKSMFFVLNQRRTCPSNDFSKVTKYTDIIKSRGITQTCGNDVKASVLLHSGGTTDEPKIIMLNDLAINSLARKGKKILGIENAYGKGMLAVLPIFHGFGLCMCIHTILMHGGISVMFPKFMRKEIASAINKGKINFMAGVPTMYDMLLKTKGFRGKGLSEIEFAFVGGDSLSSKLKSEFDEVLESNGSKARLCEGYGLTETITVCAVNNPDCYVENSIGSALTGNEMAIINEDGEFLPPFEVGEIVVRGDTLMMGYYDSPIATKEAFFEKNNFKWIKTGDLGYADTEGNFFFKQRRKRVIKVNGVSVFPREIEEVAFQSNGVERACAVPRPDSKHGSVVVIYIQPKKEADDKLRCELEDLFRNNLIKYAIPKEIIFVKEFKLTAIGKIDFRQLMNE